MGGIQSAFLPERQTERLISDPTQLSGFSSKNALTPILYHRNYSRVVVDRTVIADDNGVLSWVGVHHR